MENISRCVFIFIASASLVADAAEPAPSDQELKKAAGAYAAAIKKARADLLPKFEKIIDDVRKAKSTSGGDKLATVEELKKELQDFEEDGIVPNLPALKPAVAAYLKASDVAAAKFDVIVNKAVNSYTKQGKDDKAALVLKYRNQVVIGTGFDFVGEWRLADGKDGANFTERFVIRKKSGRWSVERSFYNEIGIEVGSSTAASFVFSEGVLQYTEEFVTKPVADWPSGVKVTVRRVAGTDELDLQWNHESRGLSGRHKLSRAK
jgi:hypothetical protein